MGLRRILREAARLLVGGVLIACSAGLSPLLAGDSVHAAGFLTLSADDGHPGDAVLINGSGFTANQGVSAYFSNIAASIGDQIGLNVPSYQLVGQAQINAAGSFDNVIGFSVPGVLTSASSQVIVGSGDCYVYVTYSASNRIEAVAKFFILGPVVLTPNKGKIGDSTSINAAGLPTNNSLSVYFSSRKVGIGATIGADVPVYQYVGLVPVLPDGTLGGGMGFRIPSRLTDGKIIEDVHGGDYYFYTTNYLTRTTVATVSHFTVLDGSISLQPGAAAVDTEVSIAGQGLRPGQQISVSYEGQVLNIKSGDTKTDSSGKFNCTVVVPDSTAGSHLVAVSDITGNRPEAWLTVKPSMSLSTRSAAVKEAVQISGLGFGEVQEITVRVNGLSAAMSPAIVTTNRRGTFSASFQLAAAIGPAVVEVTDALGNKANSGLDVVASQVGTGISLNPATSLANPGYVGMQMAVDGTGFKPGGAITVSLGTLKTIVGNGTADAEGSFEAVFKVPALPAGSSLVNASDGATTATATFYMEGRAPPPPVPVVPGLGSRVPRTTHFEWSDVQDPSGVTYIFQMAADAGFSKGVLEKTGLTRSEYTLSNSEQLESKGTQSPYYWRVKAADGAGNQSDWTLPVMFYVGSAQSPVPSWTVLTLVALVAVLGLSIGLWFYQRRKNAG